MKAFFKLVLFIVIVFCLAGTFSLAAQETDLDAADDTGLETGGELDGLFGDADADIVAEQPEVDHRATYEKAETVKVSGSFSATGGIAAGWKAWDMLPDPRSSFDGNFGLTSSASVTFDARPAPEFRVFGSLSTGFNPLDGASGWSAPAIGELYADYILADFLYTRLGKHGIGWGQGRIFNPGNLMADSAANYNVRFSVPAWSGLSLIVLTNGAVTYQELVYAAKADFVVFDTLLSPALRYNRDQGFKGLLSLKKVILKTDLYLDATTHYNDSFLSAGGLFGFFREWPDVLLYGEYQFGWSAPAAFSHDAVLALGLNNIFGTPMDLGLQVRHYFLDHSGTITLGLTQPLWPFVKLDIGLPIIYGPAGSSAVLANGDPSGRRILLALALTLSGGF